MSEMTVKMSRKIFLEVCMGIEGLCAEMYHYYSTIYEDIPEASRLWKKTALEEENHQKQFGLALHLMNETEFEVSKDGLKRAYSIQHKLLQLLEHVRNNQPELLTAVSKAVEMEEQLADLHAHSSLNFTEESMQNLFQALSEADRDHVADMQRYRTILYLPLTEMEG
jgi:rubrerythrin